MFSMVYDAIRRQDQDLFLWDVFELMWPDRRLTGSRIVSAFQENSRSR